MWHSLFQMAIIKQQFSICIMAAIPGTPHGCTEPNIEHKTLWWSQVVQWSGRHYFNTDTKMWLCYIHVKLTLPTLIFLQKYISKVLKMFIQIVSLYTVHWCYVQKPDSQYFIQYWSIWSFLTKLSWRDKNFIICK